MAEMSIPEMLAQAVQHFQVGRLREAEEICRKVLEISPRESQPYRLLGLIEYTAGEYGKAEDLLQRAIGIDSKIAEYYDNLSAILYSQGRNGEAEGAARRSISLEPRNAGAHNNLGAALRELCRLDQAAEAFRHALGISPNFAMALNNLLNTYFLQKKFAEAEKLCRYELTKNPNDAQVAYDLGLAIQSQGRHKEAEECFRRALVIRPNFAEAEYGLGKAINHYLNPKEVEHHFREAIRLKPNHDEALVNLGLILSYQGRVDEAVQYLEEALRIRPTDLLRFKLATLLPPIYRSLSDSKYWRNRLIEEVNALLHEGVHFDPLQSQISPNFLLVYQGENDREIQEKIAQFFLGSSSDPFQKKSAHPRPGEKIRIGFVSSHFESDHTIAKVWGGVISKLCRERFAVGIYSFGPKDEGLSHWTGDDSDRFVEMPKDLVLAHRILAEAELDILFYTDIGMSAATYSLASLRLAPVQCVTWGHPVTTGLQTLDYFISSELLETDDADEHYTEELIRSKTLGVHVSKPELPLPRKEREDFGLPRNNHLYACLQNLNKFHPDFDELLANILRGDPQGLLVLSTGLQSSWKVLLLQRFEKTIPDVIERIHFVPWLDYSDYLRLTTLIDVLLVPPQFGGGRTSFEALAFGVPIVTLPSQFLRGRITFGLYRKLDVLDCVAHTPREYVDIAVRLGSDPVYREEVSKRIIAAGDRLFEDMDAVHELERFLIHAVENTRKPRGAAKKVNLSRFLPRFPPLIEDLAAQGRIDEAIRLQRDVVRQRQEYADLGQWIESHPQNSDNTPKAIFVIGMHRSGTSALTRVLNLMGTFVGPKHDLLPVSAENPRGHWETMPVIMLNDGILNAFGGAWFHPPDFPNEWPMDSRIAEIFNAARVYVGSHLPEGGWTLKDPRLCLTLPFWRRVISAGPIVVFATRSPLDISQSLHKEHRIPIEAGIALWESYTHSAFRGMEGLPVFRSNFDELLASPIDLCRRLAAFLHHHGLEIVTDPSPESLREFLEPNLRHSRSTTELSCEEVALVAEQVELREYLESFPERSECFDPTEVPAMSDVGTNVLKEFGPVYGQFLHEKRR